MSIQSSGDVSLIEQLKAHLRAERYAAGIQRLYPALVQRFLNFLESKNVAIEAACLSDIEEFLRRELRLYRDRHERAPRHPRQLRWKYTRPIHMTLPLGPHCA